jgi:hypothetical protein
MNNLISRNMIPATLWDKELSIMFLPSQLVSGWISLLEKNGLIEQAKTPAEKGFEGGASKEDTDKHFTWRFTGSSARVMLSMLDPKGDLDEIPNVFTQLFSGNRVLLADLPCGAGAASISILSVYCELRKQGVIPREPLEVVVIGGEISKFAQSYAYDGLSNLIEELKNQAIFLEFEIMDWDVCDAFSTAELVKRLTLRSQECSAKVLLMANFSGFLQGEKKWKKANEQIEELFRYNRGENSVALWIEPSRNEVTNPGGFIYRLINWFTQKFTSVFSSVVNLRQSSVNVSHPLVSGTFRTNLVVVRFDLPIRM